MHFLSQIGELTWNLHFAMQLSSRVSCRTVSGNHVILHEPTGCQFTLLPMFFWRLDLTETLRSQSQFKVRRLELDAQRPFRCFPRTSRPSQSGCRCAQLPPDSRDVRQGPRRMQTAGERRVNTGMCMKEQEGENLIN